LKSGFEKIHLALAIFTCAVTLWTLQLSEPLFVGAWLRPALFPDLPGRIGFALLVFVFCLSLCGLWIFLIARGMTLLRLRAVTGFAVGAGSLLALVLFDAYVRYRFAMIWGSGFSMEAVRGAAQNMSSLFIDLWRWYRADVFICLAGFGLTALLIVGLTALLRRRGTGDVGPRSLRRLLVATAVSTVAVLCLLTVLSTRISHEALALVKKTSVGYPFAALVSLASDFDRDGWGYFDVPGDAAPFDARCRPFAVDVPDDGLDQNLLAGDLDLSSLPDTAHPFDLTRTADHPAAFRHKKNVIVVFMESVRFDALTKYVDGQVVMPRMRALIRDGALVPQHAFATQGFTHASVKQFLFGGFHTTGTTVFDDFRDNNYEIAIVSGYNLQEEKFETLLTGDYVFDPRSDDELASWQQTTPASGLVRRIDSFLAERNTERPFFLFSFFIDPHFPYKQVNPPVLCKKRIAAGDIRPENSVEVRRSYYDQVHHVDRAAGALMASLEKNGLLDSTVVVFVSDHGEALYDDGHTIGHGIAMTDEMTRLAMVVVNPPIDVPDVLSHYHLRGLLRDMMGRTPSPSPRVVPMDGREVLQYVGSLRYPSQVGTFSPSRGRLRYDFKEDLLEDDATHQSIRFLSADQDDPLYQRGRHMIRRWEFELYSSLQKRHDNRSAVAALPASQPAN